MGKDEIHPAPRNAEAMSRTTPDVLSAPNSPAPSSPSSLAVSPPSAPTPQELSSSTPDRPYINEKLGSPGGEEVETEEARIERLGRERPAIFKSLGAEILFCYSILASQFMAVSLSSFPSFQSNDI